MIEVRIEKETGMVYLDQYTIGRDAENLQKTIKFTFKDEFVNGTARLEYAIKGHKYLQYLTKEEDSYNIPIRSVILHKGEILMQLVVVEPSDSYELTKDTEIVVGKTYFRKTSDNLYLVVENPVVEDIGTYYEMVDIPVFKSNVFKVYCNESINAEQEAPSEYPSWLDIISTKLASLDEAIEEVENLNIEAERVSDGVEVTITDKQGVEHTTKVNDGIDGEKGEDAKINGYNTLTITGGTNIELEQEGNVLHINNTYDDSTILQNIETLNGAVEEHDRDIQNIVNDIEALNQDIDDLGVEIDNLELNKQDKLTAGTGINITNNVISATGGGITVDIGSYQYTYEGYVLPAIDVDDAKIIYANDKLGIPQILLWTIYGNESQFKIVSSDEIAGVYSFDILVHNKYHCAYEWDDETTGVINPIVQTQQEVPTFTNNSLGVIKGSETDGNVGANADGTGSINGWTQIKNRITLLEGAVPTKVKDVKLNGTSIVNNDKEAIITASTEISDTPSDDKLVTEKTIYDYVASGNDGKTRKLDNVDLNTVTNTGFYSCNVCTNRPTANNGVMLVLKNGFSSDNLVQVYWTFAADVMWVRHKDLGNWKEWKQVLKENDVINNLTSTDTNKPLSANMGKELQDEVDNLKARGRFLALWNSATGLAMSNPQTSPYTYTTGDYFIVGNVGTTNYKPSGSTYTIDVASTVVETDVVAVDDVYYYDGTNWKLQVNTQKTLSFANIAGQPTDNTNLASALNNKQNTIDSTNKLNSNLVDDTNSANKFVTEQDKTNWNAKEDSSNKTTTISSSSTDTQYPSAKAVYDYINSLDANEVSY